MSSSEKKRSHMAPTDKQRPLDIRRWRRTKKDWRYAKGASAKPRRLHLKIDDIEKVVYCPVSSCDHARGYRTIRGCRKHIVKSHGWYYFFNTKPDERDVFPTLSRAVLSRREMMSKSRSTTRYMDSFNSATSTFYAKFTRWIRSEWGGSKTRTHAEQIGTRVLKYIKFCYPDADPDWDVPTDAVDSVLMCPEQITDFVSALKTHWKLGYAGCVGFVNALGEALDFRKSCGAVSSVNNKFSDVIGMVEILLSRTRKSLAKKMRIDWNSSLDVDFLAAKNCWATLEELQRVIPYHKEKFDRIMTKAKLSADAQLSPFEISFATSFVVAMLFLDVKASRPMTYANLTVSMIDSIADDSGMVDQDTFKTSERYGFDTLIFESQHLEVLRGYIKYVRPILCKDGEKCDYLLLNRQGKKLTKLSAVLGNMVYAATGKFIIPTRLRQIIETESAEKLSSEDQEIVSENQKHTSQVARVHYRKLRSRDVATRAKKALARIGKVSTLTRDNIPPLHTTPLPRANKNDNVSKASVQKGVIKDECSQILSAKDASGKVPIQTTAIPPACVATNSTPTDQSELITKSLREIKTEESVRSGDWGDKGDGRPKGPVRFSQEEDICLKNGIIRFGYGHWAEILQCKDYTFHDRRTSQTLQQRASLRKMKFI